MQAAALSQEWNALSNHFTHTKFYDLFDLLSCYKFMLCWISPSLSLSISFLVYLYFCLSPTVSSVSPAAWLPGNSGHSQPVQCPLIPSLYPTVHFLNIKYLKFEFITQSHSKVWGQENLWRKSLMLSTASFNWSKIQEKQQYCEIL